MRKQAGLLAGLLVVALGSGAVAQEPSPEPPPWVGGRVEMPEHGFAVTLPDDWVTFAASVDVGSQLEAASGLMDSEVWFADDGRLLERMSALGPQGMQVMSLHATSLAHCLFAADSTTTIAAHSLAELQYETYVDSPHARDVEPLQHIDLPAGPAYRLRMSGRADPESDWMLTSTYVLDRIDGLLIAVCGNYDDHPDDDWLSIAESIEFLSPEEE